MRNYILLFFLFFYFSVLSQTKKITLNVENLRIIEVLEKIENETNYFFYFDKNWLPDKKKITKKYNEVSVDIILDDLFKNTVINYFKYSETKIILTLNNVIHNSFKDLVDKKEENIVYAEVPVFYNETKKKSSEKHNVIRIGKESKIASKNEYKLAGYAKDINTLKPIPNLTLTVKGNNINAITDKNGYYSILLPLGLNTIEAKSLGFSDLKTNIIIYNDGAYDFLMSENIENLDELIIESSLNKNIKDVISGVTSIKAEEIKTIPLILGERDILRVATAMPGIKTAGEGSSGFNVRGGKGDQNLILLDNAVLYNPSHFFGIFSAINPFTTGKVDVYKGSIPAEFGGRLSSVFNIQTKDADYNTTKGELSIGPVTGNVSYQTPIVKGKSSLIFGGRATYSNWILRTLKDENLKNSKASFYDINAKYSHQINENNKLKVSGYLSNDSFNITRDSLQTYSNRLMSIQWAHRFNDKNSGYFSLANSEYKFNIEFDKNSINDFDLNYKINETELKLKFDYIANAKHKITYGISTKIFNNSPGLVTPLGSVSSIDGLEIPDERGLESAVFISDDYKVSKKLLFNFGLRFSHFAALGPSSQNVYQSDLPKNENTIIDTKNFDTNEVIKTYVGPELRTSIRYSIQPSLSIKAGFSNTYQYVHTLSNNTTAAPTDIYKLTNLNIKPQQANQVSLGLFKNINGNDYELSLESYYKNIQNIIDYKVGANLLLNKNVETEILQGDGNAYGVEFLLKKNKGKLNGWLGYSYSRSFIKLDSDFSEERVNNGDYFPTNFDKPHDLNIVANYKLTKRYSFSANFSYQTGRPVTYPVGTFVFNGSERVLFSQRNKFRIPDYYRLDIGFNIEGNHKLNKPGHSFWNISVYNVLGRNNPYSVFFVTDNGSLKAYKNSIFAIPVPTITYNIKF